MPVTTQYELNGGDSRRYARLLEEYGPAPDVVIFRTGRDISQNAIEQRKGYVEAYMMQSCGTVNTQACIQCGNAQGPFTSCKSVATELNGACACCHWSQRAADCTLNAKRHDKSTPRKRTKKVRKDKKDPDTPTKAPMSKTAQAYAANNAINA